MKQQKMVSSCLAVASMLFFAAQVFMPGSASAGPLPDLVVKNVQVVQGCRVKVTVANIGRGPVPPAGYDMHHGVGIQAYKDGQPWGGIRLGGVDPGRNVARPGGTVSFFWFNHTLNADRHRFKFVIDINNSVRESNEGNNTLERNLGCGLQHSAKIPVGEIPRKKPNFVLPNDKVKQGIQVR